LQVRKKGKDGNGWYLFMQMNRQRLHGDAGTMDARTPPAASSLPRMKNHFHRRKKRLSGNVSKPTARRGNWNGSR